MLENENQNMPIELDGEVKLTDTNVDESMHKYDESQIQVLEGLEAVRKRPGMYIGSKSQRTSSPYL